MFVPVSVVVHNTGGIATPTNCAAKLEFMLADVSPVPEVLILQETNIRPELHLRGLDIPSGWVAVCTHTPLADKQKGFGLMTLIRKGHLLGARTTVDPIYDRSDEHLDILAVKLRGLIIINVYMRVLRGKSADDALDILMSHLSTIMEAHEECVYVLAGDFNCPRENELLLELMEVLGFHPVYDTTGCPQPTHAQGNVLDWVFIRDPATASPLSIQIKAQDHAILRTSIETSVSFEDAVPTTRYNWARLKSMPDEERSRFFKARDDLAKTARSLSDFKDGLSPLLKVHLGCLREESGRPPKRWFTKEVNHTRRIFQRANHRCSRRRNPETIQAMQAAHTAYRRAVRKRKRAAVAELASRVDLGIASIHRLTGQIKKDPRHQARILPNLDLIKEFWTHQYSDADGLSPDEMGHDLLLNFSPEEVSTALNQLDPKKATGEDDIRAGAFGELNEGFLKDLARLYTLEAQSDQPLPGWLKEGNATLLYKQKGSKADPGNYRVIIINSFIAKLFEKMLEIKGRDLIKNGEIHISVEQGGFMPRRSTHDNLFLLESLRDAQVAKGRQLYAAFLDLRKAFDSVNHKKFIALLRARSTPEAWVSQLIKLLAGRKMKLFDALISLEVGTAQGSPISPLLFIIFIDPLIQRLRARCKGVRLTLSGASLRDLGFADDMKLLTEDTLDLQVGLEVSEAWAQDFGMTFNAAKCELIQIVGRQPAVPAELRLGDRILPWVKQVTYLGTPIIQGRRSMLNPPLVKMWKAYHGIKSCLSSSVPVSLTHQILLINTHILGVALYPSAVRDMNYRKIDKFVNKCLCRIVGVPQRWTSATFLRAELGVYSSEYYAHRRALSHLWHIHNHAWFRNHLADLCGKGPLRRLEALTDRYMIAFSDIRTVTKDAWKTRVKKAITLSAAVAMNEELQKKGLPSRVERNLQSRPYIMKGGAAARAGLKLRWEVEHEHHVNKQFSTRRISLPNIIMVIMGAHLPKSTSALRLKTIRTIACELSGQALPTPLPPWVEPHVQGALSSLWWPNQTDQTLRDLLKVVQRVMQWEKKRVEDERAQANLENKAGEEGESEQNLENATEGPRRALTSA